jgi:hypothetical protein
LLLLCKLCHAQRHAERGEAQIAHLIRSNRTYPQREPKHCAFCAELFQPPYTSRLCCSLPCARALSSQRRKGQTPWNKGRKQS